MFKNGSFETNIIEILECYVAWKMQHEQLSPTGKYLFPFCHRLNGRYTSTKLTE